MQVVDPVSPDLLAIQAAVDLWKEKDYRLLDLVAELKDSEPRRQLLIRLATMGEYTEMKEAVGRILSRSGLYPRSNCDSHRGLPNCFSIFIN